MPSVIAASHAERFRVYQNNVIAGLSESLYGSFPALVNLLGENYFRAVAREFVRVQPPCSPVIAQYGLEFPRFIESFKPLADMPYLADIARLELARIGAFHAAESLTLGDKEFSRLDAARLESATFVLHPSLRLTASNHPIFQLWHSRLYDSRLSENLDWQAEQVMCLRQNGIVTTQRLQSGGATFFNALMEGRRLIDAWAEASAAFPAFNLTDALSLMIHGQLVVSIIP